MFNGRLQPRRTIQAVCVLFLLAGVLGLVAATGRAGQIPANVPPSTNKAKAQLPSRSAKPKGTRPTPLASGKVSRKPAAGAAGAEAVQPTTPRLLSDAAGRRDPFKSSEAPGPTGESTPGEIPRNLPPGIRGLVISQLRLEGVVRQAPANTMIAVVTNPTKRAYFLRVNDAVYNGVVSKITPDALYFKENTLDSSGRVANHEVEIKLGSAPGEGR